MYHTVPSAVKSNKITNEFSGLDVPEFDPAIITAGHDKVLGELEASDCTLVLVGTVQSVEAVARAHIPHLTEGKGVNSELKTRGVYERMQYMY